MTEMLEAEAVDSPQTEDGGVALGGGPLTVHAAPDPGLGGMLPRDGRGLAVLAREVAASGLFTTGNGQPLTPKQAFVIAMEGAYYGITPFTALRHITLINGKPTPSALLLSALINRDPRVIEWEVDSSPRHCTIRARRTDRRSQIVVTVKIENVPAHLMRPSRSGAESNYVKYPEDMLTAWCVRRIAKRAFADIVTGLSVPEYSPQDVVDIEDVSQRARGEDVVERCGECGGKMTLHAGAQGGAYLRCDSCGDSAPPPQDVRDAVRGHKETVDADPLEPPLEELPIPEPPPPVMSRNDEVEEDVPLMKEPPPLDLADPKVRQELYREVATSLAEMPLAAKEEFLARAGKPESVEPRVWLQERGAEELLALRDAILALHARTAAEDSTGRQ